MRYPGQVGDNVEIIERVQTALINGTHRTWIEFVVGTDSSGEIAIFTPSRDELERGEGELAVEHLRREATAFADQLVATRNAFRTAREGLQIPHVWRPLLRRVHIEGDLTAPEPGLERVLLIVALGAVLGIAGYALPGPWSEWTGPISGALIAYALLGLAMTSHADRNFALGAGLSVPVRIGRPTAAVQTRDTVFTGPYRVLPQIVVERSVAQLDVVPLVEIIDRDERTVCVLTANDLPGSHAPDEAAAMLLRQADVLVDELENNEDTARRLAAGDLDRNVPDA